MTAPLRPTAILRACYTSMFVQAMVVNLTPLLFVTLQGEFGLSFEQVGRLVAINFGTQLLVDLLSTGVVDRLSARALAASANALGAIGLWLFATAPYHLNDPYLGLALGTVVFSIGCGLLEVIVSPIVERTPSSEPKAAGMAFLHAFYPIGKVVVTIVTGLAFLQFGTERWPTLLLIWSVVPAVNTLAFLGLRLPALHEAGRRTRVRDLLRHRATYVSLLAIFLAGAAEVGLAQWASAYAERGLGVGKATADLFGLGSFGAGMVIGRVWFGYKGVEARLPGFMRGGSLLAGAMALVMATQTNPVFALAATGVAGFAVALLWPGVVSLTAARFPQAGASLFALLAAAGDAGAGAMPWAMGIAVDAVGRAAASEAVGLRAAVATAAIPALLLAALLTSRRPRGL